MRRRGLASTRLFLSRTGPKGKAEGRLSLRLQLDKEGLPQVCRGSRRLRCSFLLLRLLFLLRLLILPLRLLLFPRLGLHREDRFLGKPDDGMG
jgi:hypothetical protein